MYADLKSFVLIERANWLVYISIAVGCGLLKDDASSTAIVLLRVLQAQDLGDVTWLEWIDRGSNTLEILPHCLNSNVRLLPCTFHLPLLLVDLCVLDLWEV